MADNTTKVFYEALADFSALHKATLQAKKDIKDLQKAEAEANAQSLAGDQKTIASKGKKGQAAKDAVKNSLAESVAAAKVAESVTKEAQAEDTATVAKGRHSTATKGFTAALSGAQKVIENSTKTLARHRAGVDDSTRSTSRFAQGYRNLIAQIRGGDSDVKRAGKGIEDLGSKINKALSKRSQIGGLPFAALIPIILGVVGAINPLISLLGVASGAAIGFANSLSSLSGVALALPGIFSAAASGIASLLVAFSGVGGVFKAFGAAQKAGGGGGGGGGGQSAEERANGLADAEDRLARAQKNVTKAQDGLNKARQQAIRDLQDLQKLVARAATDEQSAIAGVEQAQQDYNNILADPGSTKADKDQALANLTQAQQDLEDVKTQNVRNAEDLADAQKKGIEGSDQVVSAQDQLTSALTEQRDALVALKKAQQGVSGGGGGGGGYDAFQAALDKLSPSAQKFVLGLIAMKDKWDALRKSVQENFFSEIVKDLPLIEGFLPTLNNLLGKSASALGKVADKAIKLITSGPWTKDFGIIADQNAKLLTSMGDGALYLLSALKDIIVAAGPFTQKFVDGLAKGAKNFSELVANARQSGQLSTWLEKVYSRLQQWWRIVKNIGSTLFNYGSAASEFGTWITDGFERITEAWKDASEEAKKPDSAFKKWLESIKPVVSEIREILGHFFSWLKTTSGDPKNIETLMGILKSIDQNLGPAVGDLLQSLADTKVSQTLIDGISSIADSIAAIIKNGGGDALKAVFNVLEGFFKALADFAKTPGGGKILGTVATSIGTLVAINLVGKFTGITKFIQLLITLSGKQGALIKIFAAITGMKLPTLPASATDETIVTGGKGKKGKGGLGAVGGTIAKTGIVALIVATIAGLADQLPDAITNLVDEVQHPATTPEKAAENQKKETQGEVGVFASPVIGGLGLIDSAAGTDLQTPFKEWLDNNLSSWVNDMKTGFNKWLFDTSVNIASGWKKVTDWWNGVILNVGLAWKQVTDWWNSVILNIGLAWKAVVDWWNKLISGIGQAWNGFVSWLTGIWNNVVSFARSIWTNIQNAWNGAVSIAKSIWSNVQSAWNGAVATAKSIWTNVQNFFSGIPGWIQARWNDAIAGIGRAFSNVWGAISDGISRAFAGVGGWLRSIFGYKGGEVRNRAASRKAKPSGGPVQPGTAGGKAKPQLFNRGGMVQYLAAGGRALEQFSGGSSARQLGTDTAPAMLTPGEFVLRKGIVDAIGADNLQALNEGLVSYSDLLDSAMRNQKVSDKQREKNLQASTFFSGAGLAGRSSSAPRAMTAVSAPARASVGSSSSGGGPGMIVEQLHVHNPVPETASDSLPRTIRKVSYLGQRR